MRKLIIILFSLLLTCCGGSNSSTPVSQSSLSSLMPSSVIYSEPEAREGHLQIYAVNDYHGAISENTSQKINGISKVSAFLNEQKQLHNQEEYLFLNAGDLWQDTYESEASKGECLIECFGEMDCEAMCLGNHEFDWGLDVIRSNKIKSNAKDFNLLGANVYYYDKNLKTCTNQASDLCDEYKIVERNNLKIGIIGIIGESQITSITSSIWENIAFVEPLEIVKNISDNLRTEKDCDLVVLLAHSSYDSLGNKFVNAVTSISDVSNHHYIDACFTGHSHTFENELVNGVPFVQSSQKGQAVSSISLVVNKDSVTVESNENLIVKTEKNDAKIDSIVQKYITSEFNEIKNEQVFSLPDLNSFSIVNAGRLQAYATYDYLKENYAIDVVLNNGGRDNINVSSNHALTNETLFNSTPFYNKTIVCKLNGYQILNLIKLKSCKYYCPNLTKLEDDTLYTVGVIDYVLLHKNTAREYDYVSGYDGNVIYTENKTPFELMKEFSKTTKILEKMFFNQQGFTSLK